MFAHGSLHLGYAPEGKTSADVGRVLERMRYYLREKKR